MGSSNRSAASGQSRAIHLFDAQPVEPQTGTHNIDDRIRCANLMEVNRLDITAMNCGFGFSQSRKDTQTPMFYPCRELSCSDQRLNFAQVTMVGVAMGRIREIVRVILVQLYQKLRGNLAVLVSFHRGELIFLFYPEPSKLLLEVVEWHPGVHKRAEAHVPSNAGRTVKVSNVGDGLGHGIGTQLGSWQLRIFIIRQGLG